MIAQVAFCGYPSDDSTRLPGSSTLVCDYAAFRYGRSSLKTATVGTGTGGPPIVTLSNFWTVSGGLPRAISWRGEITVPGALGVAQFRSSLDGTAGPWTTFTTAATVSVFSGCDVNFSAGPYFSDNVYTSQMAELLTLPPLTAPPMFGGPLGFPLTSTSGGGGKNLPMLTLDAARNQLEAALGIGSGSDTPFTIFIVIRIASLAAARGTIWRLSRPGNPPFIELNVTNVPQWELRKTDNFSTLIARTGGTPDVGTWHVVAVVFQGATIDLYVDGTPVGLSSSSFDLSNTTITSFSVSTGLTPGSFDFLRVLGYSSALSTIEVANITRALRNQYGI